MKKQKSSDAVNEETIVIFSACGLRSQLKKCRLALLMSTHTRLGRDSPISKIGKDVIRLIAKNYITLSSCT